jgi:hypothetical protein
MLVTRHQLVQRYRSAYAVDSCQFDIDPEALDCFYRARRDVFARGSDGALWHIAYNGTSWVGWESLGGQIAPGTAPTVAAWSANRLDVFAQGTDKQLWHKAWNGSKWANWEPLGGQIALGTGPSVCAQNANNLDVVVQGTDNGLWHKNWNGSKWSAWKREV